MQIDSVHLLQQCARLPVDVEFAQARAGIMVGQRAIEVAGYIFQLGDIDQKIGQLVSPLSQGHESLMQRGVVAKQNGVMHAYHSGAGSGGQHHIIECFEFAKAFQCHRLGGLAVPRVVSGLAATGLPFGDDDFTSGRFQQLDRGKANAWTHGIHQASDE